MKHSKQPGRGASSRFHTIPNAGTPAGMTQTPRDKPQPPRPGPLPLYLQRRIDWLMRCRTWTINYLTDIRLEELGIVRVDHGAGTTHLVEAIATGPAA